jgi:hypothetical protein
MWCMRFRTYWYLNDVDLHSLKMEGEESKLKFDTNKGKKC